MQQPTSFTTAAVPVTGLLWGGFAGLAAWALAAPGLTPDSGLALAIGLLTLFVAAIVASFSLRYMRADARNSCFFLTVGALVASVLAFAFTGNLVVLGLAWCASGWLLARLISHARDWPEAHQAAWRAQLAFAVGDTSLLAALAVLGWHAGSLQIDAVLAAASTLPPMLAATVALLLVIAAAARCALPPFSGWLLSSMTAPTPVSALMHAGLVNAGGFLLIRFAPLMEAAPSARTVAVALGLCGAIYGVGIMMVRPDIKRSLAGSTVSQMGFMIMSCGLGAYAAALWHIVAHGLFKAWLFLGSGSTIGMKGTKPGVVLSGTATLAIAAVTVGVALSIISFGEGSADASLIPLLLGLATAIAMLIASMDGKIPAQAKVRLVLGVIALLVFHGAGLMLAGIAIGTNAQPLFAQWVLLALLVGFLAAWSWQQHRLATGRGLPLPLYVHLINAGSLFPAAHGEKK